MRRMLRTDSPIWPETLNKTFNSPKATELSRRHFLCDCGLQIGTIALATLLGEHGSHASVSNPQSVIRNPQSPNPLTPKPSHFAPKAKRVIFLFMAGGPSHLDLFDPKPLLQK